MCLNFAVFDLADEGGELSRMKEVYSPHEVSAICRVSADRVFSWIKERHSLFFQIPGGHYRISHDSLKRLMAENRFEEPPGWEDDKMKFRVLVVEDDEDLLEIMFDLLNEDPRFEVRKEDNGFSAGLLIASWRPDLILLDFVMPGVSGFDICKKLRTHPDTRDIAVLAVTSLCLPENRKAVADSGVSDFLAKPFYSEEILKRARTLLGIEEHQRYAL